MNHCLLEVEVNEAPTLRYTQDNKTPIAEMEVQFEGLRADDEPGRLKVVGWGNMAEDLKNRIKNGQRLVIEGRLRMNTVSRQDGSKEKRAELTLAKYHLIAAKPSQKNLLNNSSEPSPSNSPNQSATSKAQDSSSTQESQDWNSSPLVPDTDDIPF